MNNARENIVPAMATTLNAERFLEEMRAQELHTYQPRPIPETADPLAPRYERIRRRDEPVEDWHDVLDARPVEERLAPELQILKAMFGVLKAKLVITQTEYDVIENQLKNGSRTDELVYLLDQISKGDLA